MKTTLNNKVRITIFQRNQSAHLTVRLEFVSYSGSHLGCLQGTDQEKWKNNKTLERFFSVKNLQFKEED